MRDENPSLLSWETTNMSKEETLAKIEKDILAGNYGMARDRLHGLLSNHPEDLSLRRKLGEVYWHLQDPAMAGRYWYLEAEKSSQMESACEAFRRAFGNDPLKILSAIKFRGEIHEIQGSNAERVLLELRDQVKERYHFEYHFREKGSLKYVNKESDKAKSQISSNLWKIGCIILTLAAVGLMVIGLWAIISHFIR